jgi:CarD family transcriptional regulator
MNFQVGDTVMHWNYGLGEIVAQEERQVTGERKLYYVVKIQELSVWVPVDDMLSGRLRRPTSASAFQQLFAILTGPSEGLPDDRRERKSRLQARMAGGSAASICHVIRDLTALRETKALNDDDSATLKRACNLLLGEWGYSLKIPPGQAEDSLTQLLGRQPA